MLDIFKLRSRVGRLEERLQELEERDMSSRLELADLVERVLHRLEDRTRKRARSNGVEDEGSLLEASRRVYGR